MRMNYFTLAGPAEGTGFCNWVLRRMLYMASQKIALQKGHLKNLVSIKKEICVSSYLHDGLSAVQRKKGKTDIHHHRLPTLLHFGKRMSLFCLSRFLWLIQSSTNNVMKKIREWATKWSGSKDGAEPPRFSSLRTSMNCYDFLWSRWLNTFQYLLSLAKNLLFLICSLACQHVANQCKMLRGD